MVRGERRRWCDSISGPFGTGGCLGGERGLIGAVVGDAGGFGGVVVEGDGVLLFVGGEEAEDDGGEGGGDGKGVMEIAVRDFMGCLMGRGYSSLVSSYIMPSKQFSGPLLAS